MELEETTVIEKPVVEESWKVHAKANISAALVSIAKDDWETAFDQLDLAVKTIVYNHPLGDDTWQPK